MADDTASPTSWDGSSPWLFFVGALVFTVALVLFVYDLAAGNDVLRGIAANGVGAALLIAWAAHDTLSDPDSEVATTGGAAGTALLLYGLYLFVSGFVIAVTGLLVHDRGGLGLWYVGLAIITVAIGFVIFPTASVIDEEEVGEDVATVTGIAQAEADDSTGDSGKDGGTDTGGSDTDGGSDDGPPSDQSEGNDDATSSSADS